MSRPAAAAGPQARPPAPASLRLDVVTIFPEYLRVLDLSLIGRANAGGLLDLYVHDLRDWTHDRHRTVDDTPVGGGAGMVMKPDVWGAALDDVLAAALPTDTPGTGAAVAAPTAGTSAVGTRTPRRVLVIPTPSGALFTQRTAEDLADADQLVFACGRYEGIDARVAQHYAANGLEVCEVSIGDYVLNGGEAAALVMIEAIARLRPGVLGNPESVVEESHTGAGLLEYPVYARPVAWRGLDLAATEPELLSGDHARVARHRRDQAIARTAARRPDLIARADPALLDAGDRVALVRNGWVAPAGATRPVPLVIRPALEDDLEPLAELAASTFPDACPSFLTDAQIAAHIAVNLSPRRLAEWLADPRVVLTVAELPDGLPPGAADSAGRAPLPAGALVGYSAVVAEVPDADGALPVGLDPRPPSVTVPAGADGTDGMAAELSKVYVDAGLRASGIAAALLAECICDADTMGATTLWLGTNDANRRAQKAYRRAGFRKVGTRTYQVGGSRCRDVVMALDPRGAARVKSST
ncbi:tRNA (guanosine(37)-N1)-methyltransferase TrmD [Actinomyces sp. 432]|uniref:tRNA (guanosine(37)-N1)-methyltransferase TrmD n=1 Tax=Actinomyces sp. 432 TaxID=2057798 RepID=UPI0013742845|nr:tRNA (guanosine(37)-N1)-methyltransferase TrmD [Actinomyces sp. 432]QHO91280.1 tRNA (guanosine(37)-N1)-methyltransferase TrmD [Actinomyces sp. 432]